MAIRLVVVCILALHVGCVPVLDDFMTTMPWRGFVDRDTGLEDRDAATAQPFPPVKGDGWVWVPITGSRCINGAETGICMQRTCSIVQLHAHGCIIMHRYLRQIWPQRVA